MFHKKGTRVPFRELGRDDLEKLPNSTSLLVVLGQGFRYLTVNIPDKDPKPKVSSTWFYRSRMLSRSALDQCRTIGREASTWLGLT